jgi:hypothetical protein
LTVDAVISYAVAPLILAAAKVPVATLPAAIPVTKLPSPENPPDPINCPATVTVPAAAIVRRIVLFVLRSIGWFEDVLRVVPFEPFIKMAKLAVPSVVCRALLPTAPVVS